MKREYDFSEGERGAPIKVPPGKTRITIRIDDDILAWFRQAAHDQGGGNYQTLINTSLRGHIEETGCQSVRNQPNKALHQTAAARHSAAAGER